MIARVGMRWVTVLIWEDNIWVEIERHRKGLPKQKIMARTLGRENSRHVAEVSASGPE